MGGVIGSNAIARVRDIDFVDQFSQGVNALLGVLGIYDVQPLQAGYQIQQVEILGNLEDGAVTEGQEIPLSLYREKKGKTFSVNIKQYRKQTSKQAILKGGYENAVARTDEKMVRDIQGSIRKDLFTFLTGATGQSTATGTDFQKVIANAYGVLANEMSKLDTDGTPIFFANPLETFRLLFHVFSGASKS